MTKIDDGLPITSQVLVVQSLLDITREEFYRAIDDVKELVAGTHTRLDALNGRTRTTEINVAALTVVVDNIKATDKRRFGWATAIMGAVIALFELLARAKWH